MPENRSGGKNKFTKAQVLKAIPGSGGIISNVARKLKCDWITARRYLQKMGWEDVEAAFAAEKEAITDTAEIKLVSQIKSGEPWAVKFWLTTIGKDRGFTERKEVTGAEGAPIEFTLDIGGERDDS